MSSYRRRLERDVIDWKERGILSDEVARRILSEVTVGNPRARLPAVLGLLASVLLSLAALSFVAAHWDEIPRLARLAMLLGLMWTGYGLAGLLASRRMGSFADAAILFSAAIFGISIMLISQMFHIDGNPPDGVLLWWLGVLLAGVVLGSNSALAFAMLLVCIWGGMETEARAAVYWPFLLGWSAVTAAFIWRAWRPGLHLSALAISIFVVSLGYLFDSGHDQWLVIVLGLAASGLTLAVRQLRPRWEGPCSAVLGYAMVTAFAGLFAAQFIDTVSIRSLLVLAALTLVGQLIFISYGLMRGEKPALWIGYATFSVEVLALYWKTVGSLLDTSLFFLIAGLIVAALAAIAWKLAGRATDAERRI